MIPAVSALSGTRSVPFHQQHFTLHTTPSFSSSWLPRHQVLPVFLLPPGASFLGSFYGSWIFVPTNLYWILTSSWWTSVRLGSQISSLVTYVPAIGVKYCLHADGCKLISPVLTHSQNTRFEYATASTFPWMPPKLKFLSVTTPPRPLSVPKPASPPVSFISAVPVA